jgi:hypothetical protein
MNRIVIGLVLAGAFLSVEPSPAYAEKWVLLDSDGQYRCARGFRPDGGHRGGRGPSVLSVHPSKESCEASRTGKPLKVTVVKKLKPTAAAVKAVRKVKPVAVPVKKKKKKIIPPPLPPEDDNIVH